MTNSEAIREMTKTVTLVEAQLENARTEIVRVVSERQKALATLIDVDKRLAVFEEKFAEFRGISEEQDRKGWTVKLAVIVSLLSLAVNIGLLVFKK